MSTYMIIGAVVGIILFALLISLVFRKVVETNKVHIVQSGKKTTSYGTGQKDGNVYYNWPSWMPFIGVTRVILPVNNFNLSLDGYKAYDQDRVPFELDLTAFFRISDTNLAAERISSFDDLHHQLEKIVQGAARKILASHDINTIMVDRSTFGNAFTDEVRSELAHWGVEPVKNMELMDIRDADGSEVIKNIMAKKSSFIAMESRVAVAQNDQAAQEAEIDAKQAVDVRQQDADQAVGIRQAEQEKTVGIAREQSSQEVQAQAAITAEREMEVTKVRQVRQAEIDRDSAIVAAEQTKTTTTLDAEGQLAATKLRAEGVITEGEAKAAAETAMQLAPIQAQITLAKEIGTNDGYQTYLLGVEAIKGYVSVGTKQADALSSADVKIIANAGTAVAGADSAMSLFTPNGGMSLGGMVEAFGQMPEGQALLRALKTRFGKPGEGGGESAAAPAAE